MSSYDLSWVLSLGFQRALLCQIATIKGVRFPEGRSGGCQEFGGGGGGQDCFLGDVTKPLIASCFSRISTSTKVLRHKGSLAGLIYLPFPLSPVSLLTTLSEVKISAYQPWSPLHLNSFLEPSRIRTETQIQEPFVWKTFYWSY